MLLAFGRSGRDLRSTGASAVPPAGAARSARRGLRDVRAEEREGGGACAAEGRARRLGAPQGRPARAPLRDVLRRGQSVPFSQRPMGHPPLCEPARLLRDMLLDPGKSPCRWDAEERAVAALWCLPKVSDAAAF
jgi:hypothetical protein